MSALVTACGAQDTQAPKPHADGEGVLSVRSGRSGLTYGLGADSSKARTLTFGFYPLCTQRGQTVTLTDVDFALVGDRAEAQVYLRHVPALADRISGEEYSPPGGLLGRPRTMRPPLGGTFTPVAGTKVSAKCDPPPGPGQARQDINIVMTAHRPGAQIDGFTVAYTFEGESRVLKVADELTICGSQVHPKDCD